MKWYYNMKIGVKLIIGFLIVSFIAGAIGIVGVLNIKNINNLDTKLYETVTVPLGEMVLFVEAYHRMRGNVKDILLSTTEAEVNDYESRVKARNDDFNTHLSVFEKTVLSGEAKKLTKDLIDYKKQYDSIINDVIKLAKENSIDQAKALLMNKDTEAIRKEFEAVSTSLIEMLVAAAHETSSSNTKTANAATIQTIIFLLSGMAVSIFFGVFIAASVRKPLNKLVNVSEKIADGDLDVTVDIDTKDEVGVLAQAFTRMTDNINDAMTNINTAAEQVASGSKQVSDSSMALSQGATEQASSIEELTASLEEISSQTKMNAQNANQANELAESARSNAVQGNTQMKEMLKAMVEINDSSANISKIIKVIDEIAFQTNILALNAAVEAARAGQHGKGFAVVAEEVRNLAARSANAAKETTDMIEGSIKKVEGGTRIANETANALNNIVEGVARAAALVGDIAIASNEQASGIAQINQGIMQVSQVVQTNSATSEESAAASEELSSQAELLRESVSRFKLRKINQAYNKFKEFNPEILRMLEDMSERKKAESGRKELPRTGTPVAKAKIALSDTEFAKY